MSSSLNPATPRALLAAERVDCLVDTWQSLGALAGELTPADWLRPTGCPGWTVFDQLAHVVGLEAVLSGEPQPDVAVAASAGHVRDDFGRRMEQQIIVRRGRPPAALLAELEAVTERRRAQLAAQVAELTDDTPVTSPLGEAPFAQMVAVRVADCYLHEQDVRRAVDRAGHLEGRAPALVAAQMAAAFGMIVSRRAALPDGTTVALEVTGPTALTQVWRVSGSRASLDNALSPANASLRLTMPLATYLALSGGRADADRSTVGIVGDPTQAAAVLDHLAITP